MNKKILCSPIIFLIFLNCFFCSNSSISAQNDVMMQGFNFNVPVDEASRNGTWWDNLADKSQELKEAGFTGIWTPPPSNFAADRHKH